MELKDAVQKDAACGRTSVHTHPYGNTRANTTLNLKRVENQMSTADGKFQPIHGIGPGQRTQSRSQATHHMGKHKTSSVLQMLENERE